MGGVHIIPERDGDGKIIRMTSPFKSKTVQGGKLFRRKHGFKSESIAPNETSVIEINVPYDFAKINEVEFCNCDLGDEANFKVCDTPQGSISGTPGTLLNQFGFGVKLPQGFYKDQSDYDADLIKDMKIVIEYKNNSSEAKIARGNIVFHEVKQ